MFYKIAIGGHGIEASSLPFLLQCEVCIVSKYKLKVMDSVSRHFLCEAFLTDTMRMVHGSRLKSGSRCDREDHGRELFCAKGTV